MKELITKIENYILAMNPGESIPIHLKVSEENRSLFIEIAKLLMYAPTIQNREFTFSDDYQFLKCVR